MLNGVVSLGSAVVDWGVFESTVEVLAFICVVGS